jgi:fucose 4-O-acetylase-like acetyltransferase
VVANLDWSHTPAILRDYVAPRPGTGLFPFFPCASYAGFGLAAGTVVKRSAEAGLERMMQWSVLIGFGLIWGGQYFSNIPYSIYTSSDFWSNSPALILIRAGICLLLMAGAYLWTERCAGTGWSWMRCLGMNSLMVYWVHVQLVYSDILHLKGKLSLPETVLATLAVAVLMVGLSAAWLKWKAQRAARRKAAPAKDPALSVS